jgi:hypothetical protein
MSLRPGDPMTAATYCAGLGPSDVIKLRAVRSIYRRRFGSAARHRGRYVSPSPMTYRRGPSGCSLVIHRVVCKLSR